MTPKQQTVGERIVAEWRKDFDYDDDPEVEMQQLAAAIDRAIEQAHRNGMTEAIAIVRKLKVKQCHIDEAAHYESYNMALKEAVREIEQARDGRKGVE